MAAQLLFLCPAPASASHYTRLACFSIFQDRLQNTSYSSAIFPNLYRPRPLLQPSARLHKPRACQHEGRRAAGTVGVKSPLIGTWWQGERASSILIQLRNNASEQIKVVSARLKTAHRGLFQSVLVVNVL